MQSLPCLHQSAVPSRSFRQNIFISRIRYIRLSLMIILSYAMTIFTGNITARAKWWHLINLDVDLRLFTPKRNYIILYNSKFCKIFGMHCIPTKRKFGVVECTLLQEYTWRHEKWTWKWKQMAVIGEGSWYMSPETSKIGITAAFRPAIASADSDQMEI